MIVPLQNKPQPCLIGFLISIHQAPIMASWISRNLTSWWSNHHIFTLATAAASPRNALISPGGSLLHPAAVGRIFGSFRTASKPHTAATNLRCPLRPKRVSWVINLNHAKKGAYCMENMAAFVSWDYPHQNGRRSRRIKLPGYCNASRPVLEGKQREEIL